MITTAPLPAAAMLWSLARRQGDAAAPWRRPGDRAMVLARSCWSLALLAATRGPAPRVAVPAWFCAASLAPLRTVGARLTFVPVDGDGNADWATVEAADMIVAVHTFGRPVRLEAAAAARARTGAILVEDAAHALGPAPGIGQDGDYVLYSPHKLLAQPDGAVLIARSGPLPAANLRPAPPVGGWLRRRWLQRLIPDRLRPLLPLGGQADFLDDPAPGALPEPHAASALSLRLMAGADLAAEATARRANALDLRRALGHLDGWEPLFADDDPAPYRFALRCRDPKVAATRYAALRRARLPVESWPDLAPEAAAGEALRLRRTVILLPVHSSLPAGYAQRYARALQS